MEDEEEGMRRMENHADLFDQDELNREGDLRVPSVEKGNQGPSQEQGDQGPSEEWRCHGLLQKIQDSPRTHRKADKAEIFQIQIQF